MKKNSPTTIEITDSHIKLFQAKTGRTRPIISACDVIPISQSSDDEIVRVLGEIVRGKNIQPDDIVVIIPRRFAIIKQMRLPSHNEAEIKKMIGLHLVNQIPYGLEDVIYDYDMLDKEPGGYSKVLVTIIHKDISRRYVGWFNRIGLPVSRLTISSFGILGWYSYQERFKKLESNQTSCIINIDQMNTEIVFCHAQRMYFSRQINYGAKDLTSDNMIGLISQTELSLNSYQKESMGPEVKKIIILSTMAEANIIRERMEQQFKVPAEIMTSLENVLCQRRINLSGIKSQPGLSLAVGLGLLLAPSKRLINLTPQEVHIHKQSKLRKKELVIAVLLLMITAASIAGVMALYLYQKIQMVNNLKDQLAATKPKVSELRRKEEFVGVFRKRLEERILIPELMATLASMTPAEISYRSLELNDRGVLSIQGYAQTGTSVNNFQSTLVRSPVFSEVNLEFATKRKIFNMEVTDFKITSKLKPQGGR